MAMSGLLGEAEIIGEVADDWDRFLRFKHPGSIRYFKMQEAMGLTGEFRHWQPEKRDEKVRQMARVIDRADLLDVGALLDLEAFAKIAGWGHMHGRHSLNQPYLALFQYILVSSTTEAIDRGLTSPMEIVFDEQDIFRPVIAEGYEELRQDQRQQPERFAVMPIRPWFRDDRECVMLQAADLLAGQMRLCAEDGKDVEFVLDLCPHLNVSRWFKVIDEEEIQDMNEHVLSAHRDEILGDSPLD